MAEIIKQSWVERIEEYRLVFDTGRPGVYWSFPCDKNGVVDLEMFSDVAAANYESCINSDMRMYVRDDSRDYRHPTIIACEVCTYRVTLSGFTNTCDHCGADYSLSGQRLAPRSRWGEETGETAGDILMGGFDEE